MTLLDAIRNLAVKDPPTAAKRKLYKTNKILGEGTFGVVKEATYLPTGRNVALKGIKKRTSHDSPEVVEAAVKREMAVLQTVRHPHIIALLDWFETKDKHYLVFELATGGELYDRIAKKGKFTERDAARIIFTILDAVAFLHEKDIVHRDLKPENLLYRDSTDDADLVIADFGVSNFVHGDELLSTLCGSPMYAAPEVIKRSGHGKPADIWSVGIITYCLLVGYPPFDFAEDLMDLMDAITSANYKFDSPYWDNISDSAKEFIRSLLKVKPAERPTARQASIHPWLCKYSFRAREAERLFHAQETLPPQTPPRPTEQKSTTEQDAILQTPAVVPRRSITPTEDDDLPNLVERVWSAHSDSLFSPRGKLLKAFRTLQAVGRMSSTKKGSSSSMEDSQEEMVQSGTKQAETDGEAKEQKVA
ncbi:CAMK/CAMK1 protein kinase [Spizellomyces punctatus DAOM BR117]|uniref:CAMK/CAMK1 protein kinase n=1 Tax=Spizellomyces punctatus (strain DAOM BR117) TaxID=645134 RepID=A0A0L0HPA9_SPIPD|nr:CAMK/CAMK1 protein kinase [Spizellomyces punctatus DAOM BR117]KND02805.1 CAMK/CAMK1 protein kinase [Spizellomyces punctatus DAOM BR117]|eukprot:XP_016610844.1 CAMK/CAMK1 protein kinase [Spizellomyces punctatus DAOM BR117]